MAARVGAQTEFTDDPTLDRIQAEKNALARQVASAQDALPPFLDPRAKPAKNVVFVAAVWRVVTHGLGYLPRGFLVTNNIDRPAGAGSSTRIPNTRNPTAQAIEMISDVGCNLDLWFF